MKSILLLFFLAVIGGIFIIFDWPHVEMSSRTLEMPSKQHWLGTDALGQDTLLRVFAGLPNTLLIAFFCGLLPLITGFILAAISILGNRFIDRILLKLTDVILLIPNILPLMLLAALLEPGLVTAIILICALSWPDDYKVLRTSIFRLIKSDAVLSAQHFGAKKSYIFIHYIWPKLTPLLRMLFLQNARHSVMVSAGLAFLGLTDPRLLSWGTLLMEAQEQIHQPVFLWLLIGPLSAISIFVLLLNSASYKGKEK